LKSIYRPEANSFPNLIQTLRERVRLESAALTGWVSGASVIAVLCLVALPIAFEAEPIVGYAMAVVLAYATWRTVIAARVAWNDLVTHADRVKVYRAMIQCIERNRLEHDISTSNVQVLEACAERYRRARGALKDWKAGESTVALRSRLEAGVEDAMCEAILVHRDLLPDHPINLPVGFQLGKMANRFLFGIAESTSGPVEPAFTQSRKIADQLLTVTLEVEKAAREITGEVRPSNPAVSLDSALGELRLVAQAEEELRQDLRG
jgi:hypothetical protein